MKKFIFLVFLFAIGIPNAYSQKKVKDTSTVLVYVAGQKAYQSIQMRENQIALDTFPELMRVVFPVNFWEYDIVIMNGEKDSTVFSSACKPDDTTCKTINWAKSNNYTIDFQFHKNVLTGIGGQSVYMELAGKKPVIKFIDRTNKVSNGKPVEKSEVAKVDKYDVLKVADSSSRWIEPVMVKEAVFYPLNGDCKNCDTNNKHKEKGCCSSLVLSPYNQTFDKPCIQDNDRYNSAATTLKYRIVIDDRANIDKNKERVTYLKLKNRKGFEYYRVKKRINPLASYELEIQVIGNEDSAYNIKIDNGRNYFLEEQSNFSEAVGKVNGTVQVPTEPVGTDSGKKTSASLTSASTQSIAIAIDHFVTPSSIQELSKSNVSLFTDRFITNTNLSALLEDTAKKYFKNNAGKMILDTNLDVFKSYLVVKNLSYETNLSKKRQDSLRTLVQSYYTNSRNGTASLWNLQEVLKPVLEDSSKKEFAKLLLGNLLTLSKDIKQFHHDYYNIDYRINEWARDITALRKRIVDTFHITVTSNADDLAKSLIRLVKYNVDSCYYNEFSAVIRTIEQQYETISKQKTSTKIYSKQFSVPNADVFGAEVNYANKEARGVFKKEFNVSGGFQIDFSSGLFVNGIKNYDYALIPTTFKYTDTLGKTAETTGNVIYKKGGSNITYGTGFLLHAYTRTGEFYNGGLSTGVMFDNSSNFSLLLGASLLLNTGISRVAFTGGICWGQQKKISDYASQYLRPSDTTTQVYPTLSAVPKFYKFESPETTTNWVHSWFFGITFNFASISPNSKTTVE